MEKRKNLFMVSLVLSLVIFGLFVLSKRGGNGSLKREFDGLEVSPTYSSYYLQKKDIFETTETSYVDKIFVGDSITDHGEFHEFFPDQVILNRGISKDTSAGVLNRIHEVVGRNAKEVYLLIGVNDIRTKVEQAVYIDNIRKIIDTFANSKSEIYIQSILPVNNSIYGNKVTNDKVILFNTALKQTAKELNVHFLDLFPSFIDQNGQLKKEYTLDGIHLNGKGYKAWTDLVSGTHTTSK
ncbi:GDSL-type esterase/lipase family protein [Lysinibacillus sp. SGAir0095]|uniref:GDSL-type esterase/lipase family protein n=1 Tax=Lysinibacillus sp. SGAir0095 TaxID=2070463 RepID=UPI0010CCFAE7|nr:GDSL-type esterase/lipase family protein [Lysinibacillus sp. SGAir0095]QCR31871.1 lysophospholipase [Lysinibacillus sp. SGAir0095]